MDDKRKFLEDRGFIIGERDPNMNTAFAGRFMVAEPYEAGHTQPDGMGGDGVWCVVGDDLAHLIETSADFFAAMEP